MPFYPFNESIDKLTERELVYDIVERLALGKDLKTGSIVNHNAGEQLTEVLNKLISTQPPEVILNYLKVKCGYIKISAGGKTGSIAISGLQDRKVILAISEQMGIDVKDCLSVTNISADTIICSMTTDAPYKNDEYIKIYAI